MHVNTALVKSESESKNGGPFTSETIILTLYTYICNFPSYLEVDILSDFLYTFNVHRFLVRVSYLEIYNEEVRDLLGKDQMQRLEVKEY